MAPWPVRSARETGRPSTLCRARSSLLVQAPQVMPPTSNSTADPDAGSAEVLGDPTAKSRVADGAGPAGSGPPGAGRFRAGGPPGGMPDPSQMSAEQLEQIKERMRQRGLTEEQIEERLRRMRQRSGGSGAGSNTTPTQQ